MNHESVERRFGLSPALPACSGSKNCSFAWSGNTLTYIHAHVSFGFSTAYTVSLLGGYADASGQQNTLDHSCRFITEGRPTLTAVDPPDQAAADAHDRHIGLAFAPPSHGARAVSAVKRIP